jgi:hypothetical protein
MRKNPETGPRRVDKLVKVTLRESGEEAWVLIHIEVQGDQEAAFARRMYIYNYRLFDKYDRRVASFAILSDDNPTWRPDQFGYELLGCRVQLDFPTIKLLDYESRWAELEASDNPFAVVVMAQLQTRRTRQQVEARYEAKLGLAKRLYQRGYSRRDILELFRFIDWVMALPPELEEQFMTDIVAYEEREKKPYVTSVERIASQRGLQLGLEQGLEQGLEIGRREMLLETLEARFDAVPAELVTMIEQIGDPSLLLSLQRLAVLTDSLETFEQEVLARL